MNKTISISWNGHEFNLLADRAVFWNEQKTIFIADPHFGKASSFQYCGIPVPEENTLEDCERLTLLIEKTGAENVIFLGDFFHARSGKTNEIRAILLNWRKKVQKTNLYLIRGNHDFNAGDPWPELKIKSFNDPTTLLGIECRHLPVKYSENPYLAGHIHPGFSFRGKGKSTIRSSCFVVNSKYIILPAFGSFTGLKNVKFAQGDQIFITNGDEIFEIPEIKS